MINDLYILSRGVHIAACLLLFGFWFFDSWIIRPTLDSEEVRELNHRLLFWANLILWPLVFLSALSWLGVVTVNMSGLSFNEAWQGGAWSTVWTQTQFGRVSQLRLLIGLLAVVTAALLQQRLLKPRLQIILTGLNLLALAALVSSLAWAGHGLVGSPVSSLWHPWVDVVHLLISGVWPAGLLPLALLLSKLPASVANWPMINRFSLTSLICVVLLTLSGMANSWVLVVSWENLFHTLYGWVLCAKILFFVGTIVLGADNLLRLKPALQRDALGQLPATYRQLQGNLYLELFLAAAIIAAVALLGTLVPGQ